MPAPNVTRINFSRHAGGGRVLARGASVVAETARRVHASAGALGDPPNALAPWLVAGRSR